MPSRIEQILANMLGAGYTLDPPQSRIEELLIEILESGGGGGGGGGTAGVSSFKGRRGAVVPQAGDYSAALIGTTGGSTVQAVLNELQLAAEFDSVLSTTSQKAVKNSVITTEINRLANRSLPAAGNTGDVLVKSSSANYATEWKRQADFMLKADYDPGDDGKVDLAEKAESIKGPTYVATLTNKGRNTTLITDADVAVANGVVPLDNNRKILPEFLPDNIMSGLTYGGIFNATTRVVRLTPQAKSILGVSSDTMLLQNSSTVPEGYPANISLFYITTTGGTFADMTFANGDWLISLGTEWRQLASGNQVSSVNSKTGAVVLDSDDILEGVANLYMQVAERTKLRDIETGATRDVSVLISATLTNNADGTTTLTLTNKNGTTTSFTAGETDLTDYLKKNGDSAQTYSAYTASSSRQSFSGSETETAFRGKVVSWLQQLESVAFTADYDDLTDKPTYNGVTLEGDLVASVLGTLDVQKVSELPPTRVANTMYVVVDTSATPPTVDFWVQLDALYHIETGGVVSYADLEDRPQIDGNEIVEGDQTHESLGLIGVDDFVETATGKLDGTEIVYGEATPASPIVLSEIDDSAAMKYSRVHTSSNNYINAKFDAINNELAGKVNILFVAALPDPPERNTQYYVETETEGVFEIIIVDNVGTQRRAGTTEIDLEGIVRDTRKVAGITLDADISAIQIADAIKAEAVTLTNKSISAGSNTLSDIETTNLKSTALSTAIGNSPVNTKLATEKAVSDFAVKKTTDRRRVYGTDTSGNQQNFELFTTVQSTSTDDHIPTSKAVYTFAVNKTTSANRIYGTGSSGTAYLYQWSDTYNSSADNQLFTRKGANGLYNAVRNGEQAMVFAGDFTRNSAQNVNSNTSTRILLTASDVYRTNLVSLTSNAIKILVAGTYWFRFIGRLADTAGATRAWYLGGGNTSSMADDQMGGMWSYTFNRHKAEATYLKYCAVNEMVAPWVYIESNAGTLQYVTVEVFRLNNK